MIALKEICDECGRICLVKAFCPRFVEYKGETKLRVCMLMWRNDSDCPFLLEHQIVLGDSNTWNWKDMI